MTAAAARTVTYPRSRSKRPNAPVAESQQRFKEAPPPLRVPPQAYVPYASPTTQYYGQRPRYAPGDDSMQMTAIVGLLITTLVGIPVGLYTGVVTLKRAARIEELIRNGRRPRSDASVVSGTRVAAWISIVWSIPLLLLYLFVFGLFVALLA